MSIENFRVREFVTSLPFLRVRRRNGIIVLYVFAFRYSDQVSSRMKAEAASQNYHSGNFVVIIYTILTLINLSLNRWISMNFAFEQTLRILSDI